MAIPSLASLVTMKKGIWYVLLFGIISGIFIIATIVNSVGIEETSGKISFDIPIDSGWNEVSVPVILTQTHPCSVFPGGVVYTWDGTCYTIPTDIKIGWGYWVAYAYDTTITVTGPPVITYTRPVGPGWDIIGSTIDTVPVSDIVMFPDSCASFCCDTIFPGKSCWVAGGCDSIIVGKKVGIEEANEFQVLNPNYMYIYPNPFIHFTAISYQLPVKGKVSLRIYDVSGRIIKTLVNKERERGNYNVRFDARGLRSGIYFARLVAGTHILTQKLILFK